MYKSPRFNASNKIQVAVLASYAIVNKSLQSLIEQCGNKISVSAIAADTDELIEKVSKMKPDVVLVCLMDDEKETIEVIPNIIKVSPDTRAVVLTNPNGQHNPTEVLKKGAMGIVGMNQSANVLVRAIEQVSEGETWLSQKLISQLLDKNSESKNKKNQPKGDALTKRELEVVSKIGNGMTNKEIARKLYISEATVRHHLSSIYGKLRVNDRLNLVIHAYRNGIVKIPERGH
jgi:DNA-binding NarL/FixJ family response regulator